MRKEQSLIPIAMVLISQIYNIFFTEFFLTTLDTIFPYLDHHTAGSDTIFIQIAMDAPPGVPGV